VTSAPSRCLGRYHAGEVQEYGIARETARKAVRLLADGGLVFTVQGRGTYVSG